MRYKVYKTIKNIRIQLEQTQKLKPKTPSYQIAAHQWSLRKKFKTRNGSLDIPIQNKKPYQAKPLLL